MNTRDKLALALIIFGGVLIVGSWAVPRKMRVSFAFAGTVLAACGTILAFAA